jgi:nitrogen fixation NifU-like protein
MSMYNEKVIAAFMNPKNVGAMENPDGVGEVGNATCGDVMKIYLRVKDERIEDIRFETFGCAAAIATSSTATEMVKGRTIEEALKLTNRDVANALGGLPPEKIHCSLLAEEGIRAAVEDYRRRSQGLPSLPPRHEAVCHHDIAGSEESHGA